MRVIRWLITWQTHTHISCTRPLTCTCVLTEFCDTCHKPTPYHTVHTHMMCKVWSEEQSLLYTCTCMSYYTLQISCHCSSRRVYTCVKWARDTMHTDIHTCTHAYPHTEDTRKCIHHLTLLASGSDPTCRDALSRCTRPACRGKPESPNRCLVTGKLRLYEETTPGTTRSVPEHVCARYCIRTCKYCVVKYCIHRCNYVHLASRKNI